jgi:ComF family protein
MEKEFCTDCSSGNFYVERGLARYPYESVMRQTIKNFKYGGELACGDYFAEEMADQCGRWIRSVAPDVLIPVPIHEKRMRFRGFNQAEYMAERIGKRLDIEVRTDYLLRIGETKPQKDLDSVSRKKNLQKGFCVNDTSVCYQRVLLFDDIYTTGATLEACGKALKNAGTDRIYFLCLCIGNADS